jgi:phosphoglycolate phosphatase
MALLIFDLDGTLIDSRLDLAHAVNATRAHMALGPIEHEVIFSYVGNGAPMLVRRAMGEDASEEDVASALAFFLQYYREHAVDYTVLYPGVMESLVSLHEAGHQLAVLTNKPVRISEMIMGHFELTRMMLRIYGGNSFDQKKPHPIGIDTLRSEAGTSKEDTWMVGDSYVDIETAHNAGVPSCGVTYGFRPDTLVKPVPTLLCDSMEEFADHILRTR